MWQVAPGSLCLHVLFIFLKRSHFKPMAQFILLVYSLRRTIFLAFPKRPNFLMLFNDNTENIKDFLAFHSIFFCNQRAFAFHFNRDFGIVGVHSVAFFLFFFGKILIFITRFFFNIFFVFKNYS